MNNDVLIIGNGFDLYHKLPTRYTDFLVVVENWAEFWTLYRNNVKIEETENEVERETFSVSLGENGRLTQRALQDFANHAANLNSRNLEELNDIILKNVWIKYFVESGYSSDSWIDFEAEIEKVLITIEDFFTKDIFSCEGKMLLQPLPSNKAQIIKFMITNVQSFSLNVRIVSKRDIENLVYGNSKTELLNVLKNELDGLIKAFRIYMTEFVCNIKPMVRCPQIEQLLDVNLLSFNYTYTYKSIYGNRNINQHHQVHGSLQQDDMVLGVRDDAFENWDYIYFQKFFQRIQKRTGAFYKAWIPQIRRSVEDAPIKVFIMGHSLGMTDKEILKEFFYGKYVSEITIYYHNQYAYEQLVISLVNMFGKEFVIEQTGSNRIKFIQLDSPIKVSVENEMIF